VKLDFLTKPFSVLEDFGISSKEKTAYFVIIAVAVLLFIFAPSLLFGSIRYFVAFAPIWLPIVLAALFWRMWINYIRAKFIAEQDMVLLEIKVPRDIDKSPKAMEAVFSGIHIGIGESTFIDRSIKGKVRPWYSFELVSIEGSIHFYVWTRRFLKDIVESQVYAQYPGVEIYEADDYATAMSVDLNKQSVWGCDFKLSKKDPYPIKTYIDYELDRDPKEEYKIDPIAHLFEFLSLAKQGENIWLQIIIRTNKDQTHKEGKWFEKEDRWKAEAKSEIAKIREETTFETESILDPTVKVKGSPILMSADREKVDAIQRSVGKQAFDAGVRGVYIADKDSFNANRIVGLTGVFKQFGSANLNGFQPTGWFIDYSYPWQEWFGAKNKTASWLIDAYRRRSWFHPPYKTDHYVLTTEELATIYHFPSRIIEAPGLSRIPSKKSEAPPNLPV